MALDPQAVLTPGTPEYWMQFLAARLLDRNRVVRLATLDAYRAGCPPMPMLAASDRRGFYQFHKLSRTNLARKVVRSAGDRMRVRAIRTAAADDDLGDTVAWRYWRSSGLDIAAPDVHSDMLTFSEGYVRVSVRPDGSPVALRRDPRFCIALPDPLDPLRNLVGFELLWDEYTATDYAYLWMRQEVDGVSVGRQWVASAERTTRPRNVTLAGVSGSDARRFGWWWPQLSFSADQFTMRPDMADVDEADRDGGPYCQTLAADVVPLVRFDNRDGVGEFEEHLDLLDRINRSVLIRVISAAVQAYKQRALTQELPSSGAVVDRIPEKNPETQQPINWDQIYQPGPDAMWKMPPGVKIWESTEVDLRPMLQAEQDDIKKLSAATDTPLPLLSDDVNQSAEGAQFRREGLVFRIEDRAALAGRKWAEVMALMFLFAPDTDRYAPGGRGRTRLDRADPAQIVVDWAPAERFSLAERADADSKNKTLSVDVAGEKIWGLSPAEVARNRSQRKADIAEIPALYRLSQLPAGLADNEAPPAAPPTDPPTPSPAPAGPAAP